MFHPVQSTRISHSGLRPITDGPAAKAVFIIYFHTFFWTRYIHRHWFVYYRNSKSRNYKKIHCVELWPIKLRHFERKFFVISQGSQENDMFIGISVTSVFIIPLVTCILKCRKSWKLTLATNENIERFSAQNNRTCSWKRIFSKKRINNRLQKNERKVLRRQGIVTQDLLCMIFNLLRYSASYSFHKRSKIRRKRGTVFLIRTCDMILVQVFSN